LVYTIQLTPAFAITCPKAAIFAAKTKSFTPKAKVSGILNIRGYREVLEDWKKFNGYFLAVGF